MSNDSVVDTSLAKAIEIVDAEFCQSVLRRAEDDPGLRVVSVSVGPATNRGDNYASEMFRARIEYAPSGAKAGETSKRQLIVKFEPLMEGVHKDLISKSSLFDTEISMMSDTLDKMNAILGPGVSPLNGRCLHTQRTEPRYLVIEDLAPLGFRMADRQAGLNLEHCLLAVRGLARFHGSSVAVVEKHPELKNLYTRGMFHPEHPVELTSYFTSSGQQLSREVAKWPELGPKYGDKLAKLKLFEKGCEASANAEDEFCVITHGDVWVNNMLFKYDEDNKVVDHIFVDFQFCSYASPAIDLQYFFNTSLTDDALIAHQETLLREYLDTLRSTMAKAGCTNEPPTMRELKRSMRAKAMYGMIASMTVLPMMLVDRSEVKDLGEMMGGGEFDSPAYRGPIYRKAMVRRLPKFEELGLLDC